MVHSRLVMMMRKPCVVHHQNNCFLVAIRGGLVSYLTYYWKVLNKAFLFSKSIREKHEARLFSKIAFYTFFGRWNMVGNESFDEFWEILKF